jgi:glycosyltransferase involved in cell wall biosynthesis
MDHATIVSYPGVMMPAQQVALAFEEVGELRAFATTLAFHASEPFFRLAPPRIRRELARREVSTLPRSRLQRHPLWEVIRTAAARANASPEFVDRVWDFASHAFDRRVARSLDGVRRVYAYEYTARATFERARSEGIQTVLDLPSLDTRELRQQLKTEFDQAPWLITEHQDHLEAKFEERYVRRRREIELADVLIANSQLTARSHIAAGADPQRVRVVPLAGPPPCDQIQEPQLDRPLTVVLASGLGVRKGAHYFFDAWRLLKPGAHARAMLFGNAQIPAWLARDRIDSFELRGAVSQAELFRAIASADALIFPTLSDGFGMVVTEALALGVPVITTDRAGAADRIEHGRNGLVIRAGDAAALRDSLQWCLDNRAALAAMREPARRSAALWQWSDYRAALRKAVAA